MGQSPCGLEVGVFSNYSSPLSKLLLTRGRGRVWEAGWDVPRHINDSQVNKSYIFKHYTLSARLLNSNHSSKTGYNIKVE